MHDDSKLSLKEIEKLEHKYLLKYWYFLKYAEDDIIDGFNSKNDIFHDWIGKYGNANAGISNFAVGSERVIYALLNGKIAGRANSAPVSSDLFFEVDDAFIHIDLKSVTTNEDVNNRNKDSTDNIGDFNTSIFVGENQNSYKGTIIINKGKPKERYEEYIPNLPFFYSKNNGDKKISLTYLVAILNNTTTWNTELISIMCIPNGRLEEYYHDRPLKAGKNHGKARFNFIECNSFELLEHNPKRVRVVYVNPSMSDKVKKNLTYYLHNFIPEVSE